MGKLDVPQRYSFRDSLVLFPHILSFLHLNSFQGCFLSNRSTVSLHIFLICHFFILQEMRNIRWILNSTISYKTYLWFLSKKQSYLKNWLLKCLRLFFFSLGNDLTSRNTISLLIELVQKHFPGNGKLLNWPKKIKHEGEADRSIIQLWVHGITQSLNGNDLHFEIPKNPISHKLKTPFGGRQSKGVFSVRPPDTGPTSPRDRWEESLAQDEHNQTSKSYYRRKTSHPHIDGIKCFSFIGLLNILKLILPAFDFD